MLADTGARHSRASIDHDDVITNIERPRHLVPGTLCAYAIGFEQASRGAVALSFTGKFSKATPMHSRCVTKFD
jgi:hypothetical protein